MLILIIVLDAIAAILVLISLILSIVEHNFKWSAFWTLCFGLNVICLVSTLDKLYNQTNSIEMSKPNAKDVYEGKTTLRIVYEDSIPVDTIVVFQKDFRRDISSWTRRHVYFIRECYSTFKGFY